MHTRRLYYEDTEIKEFEAEVLDVFEEKGRWGVILDRTAFYPEGGGQPCDQGFLKAGEEEVRVLDVQEAGEAVVHYTDRPLTLTKGTGIRGRIDWDRRFDLTQQHSGEHIVSGLIHQTFGYDNVGFHLGSDVVTIDFNGMLDEEQLARIEERANRIIWENQPVDIFYPSGEELRTLEYRSKKELTGEVRIVRFAGADTCACCGTHVKRTGGIGIVRILSVVKFREGVRVEMLAGGRVLSHMRRSDSQNHQISVKLSAKPGETAQAVQRLMEENFTLKGKLLGAYELYFQAEADRCKDKGDVLLLREGLDAENVRKLTDAVMACCGGRCAVFSRNEDGTYKYALGGKDADLREFTKEMNQALGGRGGGKPFFVQGSVQADEETIRAFFEEHFGPAAR